MGSSTEFENVPNFRDVGKTINDFLGERRIREGVFYRSARPDDATFADRDQIKDGLGIKTIIDLRTKTEHINRAKKREQQANDPSFVKLNAALAESIYISGIDYHEIKITGRPLEWFWLSLLGWWDFMRFLFLFLSGYRMEAVRVIGTKVMLPRGLVGLGLDTIDNSPLEIRETLALYTNRAALPSVVHCTQGKDRTGLVCALVLMILSVPVPAIEHDYGLTDEALLAEREERIAETRQIGLTEEWVSTAKDMIVRIEQHLNDKYGGLDKYLDGVGFGAGDRAMVRETLLY
ncbi:protein-tyrosine phosphatase-like protein [Dactylonectria estremocensis]|uniref:Protein-tyrosine phosphatase-like protein n=1 Tax=Dactylonectria estremocensis TaxID=1079267 RepID=A0A9P9F5A9_9HYPO|nr:protein-tyrosine phosphatase-like protein [Dactylonectria estremocensis]